MLGNFKEMTDRKLRSMYEQIYGSLTDTQWHNLKKWMTYSSYIQASSTPIIGGYYANKARRMEYDESVQKLKDKSTNIGYNIWDNPYPISYMSANVGVAPLSDLQFGVNEAILMLYNGRRKLFAKRR